jgi:hypothetical protein
MHQKDRRTMSSAERCEVMVAIYGEIINNEDGKIRQGNEGNFSEENKNNVLE